MFRSFRIRNYRLFIVGQFISLTGGWMQIVAQDWLVLQLSDNSGTALGVVTALQFLPILVFTLYAGKLADRLDKRKLLIAVNAAWAVLAAALGILVISGGAQLWHVFVFAAVFGAVNAVEVPVRQSFASELVGADLLPNALSLSAATFNTARIVGPALAGLCIAWLGTGPVFVLNALTYAGPMVGLLMMKSADLYRTLSAKKPGNVRDGLAYVRRRPDLMLPMALMGVIAMLGYNFQLTLAIMSKTVFHNGAASFGLLTSVLALGALCGALAGTGRDARPSVYVILGGALAFGILETILGFAPTYLSMVVLLFPTGFAMVYFAQACNQRVQMGVPAEYRGRVMSLYMLVFAGTTPIGAPIIGWLSEHVSARSSIWVGGLASIVTALVALAVRIRVRGVQVSFAARPWPTLRFAEPDVDELSVSVLPGRALLGRFAR
ncbi:MFS transporter [Longispora sp. NPDC051575]|uniref:MFS transporter n=1 Tax=Longispora sp. NPDC051575 TaxID=3154943 RepID=UPI00342E5AB1